MSGVEEVMESQSQLSPRNSLITTLTPEQSEILHKFWQKLFIEFDEFEKRGGIGGGSSNNWKPRGTKAYKNETESDETFTKLPSYEEFITERKESIRTVFWDLAGQAFHPDMLLLRYLNGYGWDVDKCLRRLMRTLQWRFEEDIGYLIWYGEMDVFQQLLKTGLTFTYGQDKLGYPVVYIRVKFNTPSKFKFEDRERIVYWCLETLQLFSRYTDHKATFVFDLTDYTTENVELKLVKTLVSAFATNYPETLKELIVYVNSWFFPTLWAMISPLLDKRVAEKVCFAKTLDDIREHINDDQIPKYLGGGNSFEFVYDPPTDEDHKQMLDADARKQAVDRYREVCEKFEAATKEWCKATESPDSEEDGKERDPSLEREQLAKQVVDTYLEVDLRTRRRTYYHRQNMLSYDRSVPLTMKL